jgi:hypothetical protein
MDKELERMLRKAEKSGEFKDGEQLDSMGLNTESFFSDLMDDFSDQGID